MQTHGLLPSLPLRAHTSPWVKASYCHCTGSPTKPASSWTLTDPGFAAAASAPTTLLAPHAYCSAVCLQSRCGEMPVTQGTGKEPLLERADNSMLNKWRSKRSFQCSKKPAYYRAMQIHISSAASGERSDVTADTGSYSQSHTTVDTTGKTPAQRQNEKLFPLLGLYGGRIWKHKFSWQFWNRCFALMEVMDFFSSEYFRQPLCSLLFNQINGSFASYL